MQEDDAMKEETNQNKNTLKRKTFQMEEFFSDIEVKCMSLREIISKDTKILIYCVILANLR